MNHDIPAYGLWTLVVLNSAVFLIFAFSFSKPQTPRDWRSFGAFAAFVVALFAEMYGFPLTIYLMSGWLQTRYPGLDILSHDSGHLWSTLMGETGDPHFGVPHIASYVFLGGGFWLLSSAWNVLYHAQRRQSLATAGPYARIRHPQYAAFVMILLGFHLRHGFWSAFQSIGLLNPKLRPLAFSAGVIFAIVIAVGFLLLPIFVFLAHDPNAGVAALVHS